ncbi:four helix bundle protein [Candidatus Falkowbacteria bacterium]|nr:four helix bundle protein [Candidatus Falkowbacteria bacterium]MBT7007577.1 four helix bundle protein [Candidatus Falkowbacteria bacterium]
MPIYDLEQRTLAFAKQLREFTKRIKYSIHNKEYQKQIIRSASSVGANYIEANESLSGKDFIYRIKICRKEAKETIYWLNLIDVENDHDLDELRLELRNEADELMNIFGAIIRKKEKK